MCAEETHGDCTPPVFSNYISLGQVQIVYWHISGDNDPVSPASINYIYIYFYSTKPFFFHFPSTALVYVKPSEHGNKGVPVQSHK